jgi:hypothetical protein
MPPAILACPDFLNPFPSSADFLPAFEAEIMKYGQANSNNAGDK